MISFSDIPLSELKNHLTSYGHYGLGLTKEWARENGLNPILYLDHSSYFIDSLFSMHDKVADNYNYYKGVDDLLFLTYSILRNSKNYEGKLERTNVKIENYRFSDEREWRYIPKDIDLQKYQGEFFIPAHIYTRKKSFYNIPIQSIRVKLKAKHIKYIIIKDDKEIRTTIDFIKDYVKTKYPKIGRAHV